MQCLQYNVKFTLKAIRNSKSNIVNGRTNQQSKGGEVHLENNLRMSRSRMNLIRENSRHEIEEPICTRAPSNKRRRWKKTTQANNARLKRDCSSARNLQSEAASAGTSRKRARAEGRRSNTLDNNYDNTFLSCSIAIGVSICKTFVILTFYFQI